MKNEEKNEVFVKRILHLNQLGMTNKEIQANLCVEYGIDPHSYRAWKSRMRHKHPELEAAGCFTRPKHKTKQVVLCLPVITEELIVGEVVQEEVPEPVDGNALVVDGVMTTEE